MSSKSYFIFAVILIAPAPAVYGQQTDLVRAAAVGDLGAVKRLLHSGADPNAGKQYQMPPIAFPLIMNRPDIFQALADAGADLGSGVLLFLAAYADDTAPEVVERILKAGAPANGTGPKGRDLLSAAINSGNRTMARAALKAGLSYDRIIRERVAKALPPVEASSERFTKAAGCASCHHLSLPVLAVTAARSAGMQIDQGWLARSREALVHHYRNRHDELAAGTARITDAGTAIPYVVVAASAAGEASESAVDDLILYLQKLQHPGGGWGTGARRPPIEGSSFTATALSIRALGTHAGSQEAIERAKAWLMESVPQSTEDKVMRTLGLVWAGARGEAVESATRKLLELQRPEGGWGQTETLESDPYSTGETLFALAAAGALKRSDEAWLRGIDYLLRTQQDDGTWFVRSRSAPAQPFVDSGFPYGRHQFISTAGTCWAVIALLLEIAPPAF